MTNPRIARIAGKPLPAAKTEHMQFRFWHKILLILIAAPIFYLIGAPLWFLAVILFVPIKPINSSK